MKIGVCEICGAEFEQNHHSRKYCSKECYKMAHKIAYRLHKAEKQDEKIKYLSSRKMPDIPTMMKIANELTKKTGRFHQYGDVQKLIRIGKLKIKDGAIVWSGSGLDFPAV